MTKEQAETLLVEAAPYLGRIMPLSDHKGGKVERTYDCKFALTIKRGIGQDDNLNYYPQARMTEVENPEAFHDMPLQEIVSYFREHPKRY